MTDSLLITGGRVVDPGTGTGEIRDLLIVDGRISDTGAGDPTPVDSRVIDASGLIVGPGFIDLHSHVDSIAGQRLQAFDGVTTALDLEAGMMPVRDALRYSADEGRPLNFGYSASWGQARAVAHMGRSPRPSLADSLALLGEPEWQRGSSPAELRTWLSLLGKEIEAGALGIGVLMGYAPRTHPSEYLAVARLAASAGVPTFTHVRELTEADPTTPIDGSSEVVRAAVETGAAMHHCHVNSTSRRHIDRVLQTLEIAQRAGSRVTLETYPYGAGSTGVGAFFLAPDRLGRWGIGPSNIVVLESGHRLSSVDELTHLRATAPGTEVLVEFLDDNDPVDQALLIRSLAFPDAIVASDAMPVLSLALRDDPRLWPLPEDTATHPRTAGTFLRSIRLMVREHEHWTWLEAFRRCSYLPARVLDDMCPPMRAKGHLGPGADADLVILDPAIASDRATYARPAIHSEGVRHLLVGGVAVIADGNLVPDAYPGRGLRSVSRG